MPKEQLNSRINKVNEELEKLSQIMAEEANLYGQTEKMLLESHLHSQSSSDSKDSDVDNYRMSASTGFCLPKRQMLENVKHCILECPSTLINLHNLDNIDTTIKKFRSKQHNNPRKQSSSSKGNNKTNIKSNTKSYSKNKKIQVKRVKYGNSEDKFIHSINTVPLQRKNQLKKAKKPMKIFQQGSSANTRNDHTFQKAQTDLQKQVNIKISDLNIQKQMCQRQSSYLRAAMKVSQQKLLQSIHYKNDECMVRILAVKTLARFFSQFFAQQLISESCHLEQLDRMLSRDNYLLKYMLKLPNILNSKKTLSQQRCRDLFEQKRIINRKLTNLKHLSLQPLFMYLQALHDYISFLLNNSMIHETKKKRIPVELPLELPSDMKTNTNVKQYDSSRKKTKKSTTPGLKRANTQKLLSPPRKNHKCK